MLLLERKTLIRRPAFSVLLFMSQRRGRRQIFYIRGVHFFLIKVADEIVQTDVAEGMRAVLVIYSRIDKHKTVVTFGGLNLKMFLVVIFFFGDFIIEDIIIISIYV